MMRPLIPPTAGIGADRFGGELSCQLPAAARPLRE